MMNSCPEVPSSENAAPGGNRLVAPPNFRSPHRLQAGDPHRRGLALVIVLGCLILLSVVVLGFFFSVRTNLQSSKAFSDGNASRMLAQTAINIVQAQIRQATTETNTAWASQPGMIRTYDTTGVLSKAYKLYSATTMVQSGSVDPAAEAAALSGWDAKPALFTDLNEPGVDGSGNRVYPILFPPPSTPTIEGYSLSGAPVATATGASPAPMPALWLYVLQDGTLVAPTGSAGNTATITGATSSNPIVGRVAFWTDDETCKVNINTASEGRPWTTPRYGNSAEESNLATSAPVNGEYQRFPGHPAGVSLSTVFPALATMPPAAQNPTIFSLSPRLVDGGSKGGSVATGDPTTGASLIPPITQIPGLDSARLYASVDEYLFAMNRAAQGGLTQDAVSQFTFLLTANSRAPELNLFGLPRVSIWPVHQDLATNPNSTYTTAYDRLAAFCSTYGPSITPYRYYFQRRNADSPTEDYDTIPRNQQLYTYLQSVTSRSIPGFGSHFLSKYGDDRNQILTEIFDYIRCTNLFDDNLGNPYVDTATAPTTFPQFTNPRAGTTGNTKLWAGHGQVAPIQIGSTMGFGRFYTLSEIGLLVVCTADGDGIPAATNGAANDPRTVSNLTVNPTSLKKTDGGSIAMTYTNPTLAGTPLTAGQKRLQAMLLLGIFAPAQGWEGLKGDFEVEMEGLNGITLGTATPFPSGLLTLKSPDLNKEANTIVASKVSGGNGGMRYLLCKIPVNQLNVRKSGWSNPSDVNNYPFVSSPFTVPSSGPLSLSSSSFTVRLYACSNGVRSSPTPVQTFTVSFPAAQIPVPDLLRYGVYMNSTSMPSYWPPSGGYFSPSSPYPPSAASDWWGLDNRINWASAETGDGARNQAQLGGAVIRLDPVLTSSSTPTAWLLSNSSGNDTATGQWTSFTYTTAIGSVADAYNSDVVRSISPLFGDTRLTACQATVDATNGPNSYFAPPDLTRYQSSTAKLVHHFSDSVGSNFFPGNLLNGKLVSGATYADATGSAITDARFVPNVSGDVSAQVKQASQTGDWDAGLTLFSDGAYINKPDEGNPSTYTTASAESSNIGPGATFFTPNRILSSAGMFGSLPTGVKAKIPWRTLLFRPDPAATHPASALGPKDHLFMDLFNMPVVEPYAISEPFSTAGKVNMNYQIMPYTYITRSTALNAALRGQSVTAVPTSAGLNYKNTPASSYRFSLNRQEDNGTLRQFRQRFAAGDIFRSATEICDIFLVPGVSFPNSTGSNQAWLSDADALAFWGTRQLTGDNVRERPYADLYALLTTKSNSYQIHYRVQALQKIKNDPNQSQWTEGRDQVTGERRGSVLIERYIDPADPTLTDAATTPGLISLEDKYKFRTVSSTTFHP